MATIKITFEVAELANVLALYDKMQVQRSEAGPPTYPDSKFITGPTPTVPVLVGTSEAFAGLSGKSLKLKTNNGDEQTITFAIPEPASLTDIIIAFNEVILGAVASNNAGKLEISGALPGTEGVLEITGGTAVTILGFTVGQKDNGLDANIALMVGVDSYQYDDQNGLPTNYYRSRYYHSFVSVYSSWSDWIQGTTGAAISGSNLIIGRIKLANLDGSALQNHEITIVNVSKPDKVEGYGILGPALSKCTDAMGVAEFTLVKSTLVDLIVRGTSIVRRLTVPSSGTSFDLLDDSLTEGDTFEIQVPDLPSAPRYS
jgi:hypothetical protein